jgi:hypothetical protein
LKVLVVGQAAAARIDAATRAAGETKLVPLPDVALDERPFEGVGYPALSFSDDVLALLG